MNNEYTPKKTIGLSTEAFPKQYDFEILTPDPDVANPTQHQLYTDARARLLAQQRPVRSYVNLRFVTDVNKSYGVDEFGKHRTYFDVGCLGPDGTVFIFCFGLDLARQLVLADIQPPFLDPLPCTLEITRYPSPTRATIRIKVTPRRVTSAERDARAVFSAQEIRFQGAIGMFDEVCKEDPQHPIFKENFENIGFYVERCRRFYFVSCKDLTFRYASLNLPGNAEAGYVTLIKQHPDAVELATVALLDDLDMQLTLGRHRPWYQQSRLLFDADTYRDHRGWIAALPGAKESKRNRIRRAKAPSTALCPPATIQSPGVSEPSAATQPGSDPSSQLATEPEEPCIARADASCWASLGFRVAV